jgi:hypothetical protein|tara:strand:- start:788 stop:976 length:189 start_codon:yes stop_codon:yes gene_type:complete
VAAAVDATAKEIQVVLGVLEAVAELMVTLVEQVLPAKEMQGVQVLDQETQSIAEVAEVARVE